jgi:DNA-binding NarL/FixJ family response regulator
MGHGPAAQRLLAEALRLALDTGAPPLLRSVLAAWAPAADQPALAAAGDDPGTLQRLASQLQRQHGEYARAPLSLDQAIATLQEHGAPANADQPGSPPAAPHEPAGTSRPGGLTPRELEVLRLVAQGLTDAQIAERLVLSRRTVTSYLTSVYSKLEVSGRSAATRWALEHGAV